MLLLVLLTSVLASPAESGWSNFHFREMILRALRQGSVVVLVVNSEQKGCGSDPRCSDGYVHGSFILPLWEIQASSHLRRRSTHCQTPTSTNRKKSIEWVNKVSNIIHSKKQPKVDINRKYYAIAPVCEMRSITCHTLTRCSNANPVVMYECMHVVMNVVMYVCM